MHVFALIYFLACDDDDILPFQTIPKCCKRAFLNETQILNIRHVNVDDVVMVGEVRPAITMTT